MKKSKKLFFRIFLVVIFCVAIKVSANEAKPFYIGVDIGVAKLSANHNVSDPLFELGQFFEDTSNSFDLRFGYQLNSWFSIELGYENFGRARHAYKLKSGVVNIVAPNNIETITARGLNITTGYSYRISPEISLKGFLGVESLSYNDIFSGGYSGLNGNLKNSKSIIDEALIYGVGIQYELNESWNLGLNIRRRDASAFTFDDVEWGLNYSF